MTTEMQAGVVEAPEAAEGLGLLDQIVMQSKVAVTTEGFAALGERIRSLRLPCLIVQEGGYHLESLEANAQAFFAGTVDWR